jgi:GxxExxY protein
METNELTKAIIGAAIEVHRELGPGLLESIYEEALCHELSLRGIAFVRQIPVQIAYKGVKLSSDLRADLFVENQVVVDLKSKEQVAKVDLIVMRSYLRLLGASVGLVLNFHVPVLREGVHRVVLNFQEPSPSAPPDLRH